MGSHLQLTICCRIFFLPGIIKYLWTQSKNMDTIFENSYSCDSSLAFAMAWKLETHRGGQKGPFESFFPSPPCRIKIFEVLSFFKSKNV